MMWLALIPAAASFAADCPEDTFVSVVKSAADLEVAFAELDDPAFDAAAAAMRQDLPCVRTQLAPGDVVALHRASALSAFVDGDDAAGRKSWAAVKAAQPGWKPPPTLMPEGHPVRELWNSAEVLDASTPLAGAPEGGWMIDGTRGESAPAGRAFALQGFGSEGEVVFTGYALGPEDVPDLAPRLPDGTLVADAPQGGNLLPLVAGTGLVVAGGAVFALSFPERTKAAIAADDQDYEAITKHTRAANLYTGVGLGVVALGGTGMALGLTSTW